MKFEALFVKLNDVYKITATICWIYSCSSFIVTERDIIKAVNLWDEWDNMDDKDFETPKLVADTDKNRQRWNDHSGLISQRGQTEDYNKQLQLVIDLKIHGL